MITKLNEPTLTYRVMRTSHNTTTEVCRHRWEWVARRCARRADRHVAPGIGHHVLTTVAAC